MTTLKDLPSPRRDNGNHKDAYFFVFHPTILLSTKYNSISKKDLACKFKACHTDYFITFATQIKNKKTMETAVSEKSTKAEILKAYESLLKNVQQAKADIPKQMQEEKQKKETLEKVSGIT
ncbi:MAG: hypothetical protein LBK22_08240, partial [Tannerella sp.]|nr:hypothetical protein [Tannerella sp.]